MASTLRRASMAALAALGFGDVDLDDGEGLTVWNALGMAAEWRGRGRSLRC